jgi:hypothetical protein
MTRRLSTRRAVVAFFVVGAAIALWLILRGLGDDSEVPQEEGTSPVLLSSAG